MTPDQDPNPLTNPPNTKVRDSRAGDMFHYRWAARRCLRMAHPRSPLTAIGVEASTEPLPGEYVIDLSEYENRPDGSEMVTYSQLKHSTRRVDQHFVLSELKGTLEGFGERFRAVVKSTATDTRKREHFFAFVSNRPVAANLKAAAGELATGAAATTKLHRDLVAATGLKGEAVQNFFKKLVFRDGEQEYAAQKRLLHGELTECVVGFVDSDDADRLVNLVADRVMPKDERGRADGLIRREDVLLRLNATAEQLFPALPAFDPPDQLLRREQHDELLAHVLDDSAPAIIHAEGGVGKTVVACQIARSVPSGSVALVYDCFGNATYRNPAQPRHRARDALVQMANELAVHGLCQPLLPRDGVDPHEFFKAFALRLQQAVTALREKTSGAKLVLLVDAADNAEMVAAGPPPQPCFAAELLQVKLPPGCCLTMLCRSERKHLLRPAPTVRPMSLREFSWAESAAHLRTKFPEATDNDVNEFHRLSMGNPRVQAQEMGLPGATLTGVLTNLGPRVTGVDDQIAARLDKATATLKSTHGMAFAAQMDAICYGLANLPPFIPLEVLARAAGVSIEEIRSFAFDLGRALLLTDNSVQFRDEPTETWFLKRFSADQSRIAEFATRLKPLAGQFTYVAQALPRLLFRAGDYQQVIDLALSDAHLPVNNQLDERAVRIDRLQFAFKAAMGERKLADAMRIAFRAGEEMAGDGRQLAMFAENTDLVAVLLAPHRVQELALQHKLGRAWPGCENLYTASLLCSVPDFKGEGRGYLRSGMGWLYAVVAEDNKKEKGSWGPRPRRVEDHHLVEMLWAHLALDGPKGLVEEMGRWRPRDLPFRLGGPVISRLVDAGRFQEIEEIARQGLKVPFLMLAVAHELGQVGHLPPAGTLDATLKFLVNDTDLAKGAPQFELRNPLVAAVISTLEACAAHGLPVTEIRAALDRCVALTADRNVRSDYGGDHREHFLRAAALRAVLAGADEPTLGNMLPPEPAESAQKIQRSADEKEGDSFLAALIPWYFLRAKLLVGVPDACAIALDKARERSNSAYISNYRSEGRLRLEIADARFATLMWKRNVSDTELQAFLDGTIRSKTFKFWLGRRIPVLRAALRLSHLEALRAPMEESCVAELRGPWEGNPQDHASSYMNLARAVLVAKRAEAAAYFDEAGQVISRFGDEVLERWQAIMAVAERRAAGGAAAQELAYRMLRVAEEVGDYEGTSDKFERCDAIREVTHLNPAAGIAGLSRWRDREIGWFGEQVIAVAEELLERKAVSTKEAWGLSGFEACRGSEEFACSCLAAETDSSRLPELLARLESDLSMEHGHGTSMEKLMAVAAQRGLIVPSQPAKAEMVAHAGPSLAPNPAEEEKEKQAWAAAWASIPGADVSTAEGLQLARSALDKAGSWRSSLPELLDRVPVGRETAFLALTLEEADASYVTFGHIIAAARKRWLHLASVSRYWPDYLGKVGRRCAFELCNFYRRGALRDFHGINDTEMEAICVGIGEGLAAWEGVLHAGAFFGFIASGAWRLSPAEAGELLDFGLQRFERQLSKERGDGLWTEHLRAPESPSESLAGFVWAALGSPYAETRWQAVHCVRRWAESGCDHLIRALLEWDRRGNCGAFGGRTYLFYHLHARLYLLFGLHRAAVDHPQTLVGHAKALASIAHGGLPHVLIQRTAAEAALRVAKAKPSTLTPSVLRRLERIGRPTGPRRRVKSNAKPISTPWHTRGEVDASLKYQFNTDFDDHWLEPLANVFGADKAQVIELAKEIVVKDLNGVGSDDFKQDARHHQWFNKDRGVHYHKCDYPRTDDQEFYFAYHAMHIVAGKLVQKMRVVTPADQHDNENEWDYWLRRHRLTRTDGRWLADRRDPVPRVRRAWLRHSREEHWLWSVNTADFVDCLCASSDQPGWLCAEGAWTDHDSQRVETVRVSSALVRPEAASALANSLRWAEEPSGFFLPNYRQRDAGFGDAPFDLKGWILERNGGDPRLDRMDPFAREISYPGFRIGPSFATLLKLTTDLEGREWRRAKRHDLVARAELWSERERHPRGHRENLCRSGSRLVASPDLLLELCRATKRHLIFSVSIDRKTDRGYGRRYPEYGVPSSHQIFILSADGWLRDPKKDYRVG
ncbi:ATP-binding protein [Oleiharenicola lentus]|uniref:ATP-binding protein n=1 Tax=Oleiharenicola lentus TaxID=2508720 RepID=A0A4Q1C5D9_9BACT|nr:ATP-binding protein [Oleiharenicola lentus]RXK53545.1 ATP-binding protein [Oleiharenicola lentus]